MWVTDGWFTGGENDPAKLFEKAAVQWFWSWAQDAWTTAQYGVIENYIDKKYMLFNWLGKGMQSAKGLISLGAEEGIDRINMQGYKWTTGFLGIAQAVTSQTGFEEYDGMWSWANLREDMYTLEGRELCVDNNYYVYIYPNETLTNNPFVIMNAEHVKIMEPYKN